jgi:hypothetical protein
MSSATPESLQQFVQYCQQYLDGDEKGESQNFLDRFFQAFGHGGVKEAGATLEARVKKGSKSGNMGFADLLWKPHVLIEMKKRGEDLNKHYAQAVTYWQKSQCPSYMILCNFDQFWIYDFHKQSEEPIEKIPLERLPERLGAFNFMNPEEDRPPVFNNNLVLVTEMAARRMGDLLTMLIDRKRDAIEPKMAQRFVLQCVLAMFAEDRKLLPEDLFIKLVRECLDRTRSGKPSNSYDILGNLFQEMNRAGETPAGRCKGVEYFNGGLFREVNPIELDQKELELLEAAAQQDWRAVRPSIFGNIFESAIGKSNSKERHAHGIHFTSEEDILKIVRPTITRYWEPKIDAAVTLAELFALQAEMRVYRVLDPACGSGNFLYMAYLELKRLERVLQDKINARRKNETAKVQMGIGFVTPQQFFGMDTNEFAVELARVTLMIARKVAIDICGINDQPALPLDTLDENIVCKDALFTPWEKADAIIGNPPFLGRGKTKALNDSDPNYRKKLHKIYPKSDFPNSADFCCYWFRKAHETTASRIGLVGSNSITQGNSRKASLDFILRNGGVIYDAISSQPWDGEAGVSVSIVNWSRDSQETLHLDGMTVSAINSSLKNEIDVTKCPKLKNNLGICFQGVVPQPLERYLVDENTAMIWIQKDSRNKDVVRRLLSADELTDRFDFTSDRFLIDFNEMSIEDASDYKLPFEFVKTSYKTSNKKNNDEHKKWWILWRSRMKMKSAIDGLSKYIAMPGHSKWFIPVKVPQDYLAYVNSSFVIATEDDYVLGILTSNIHRAWVIAQRSTLEDRTRYTNTTCFETFPFPQTPTQKQIDAIRATAIELHEYRSIQMEKKCWGITKLYNEYFHEPASQLAKLHKTLDGITLKAYGFSPTDDFLAVLLALNLELAEKEKGGEAVIGPWAPDNPPKKQ